MKTVVLIFTDTLYEKFRFEAIEQRKSINEVVKDRVLSKPFSNEVERFFDEWLTTEINNIGNQ